MGTIHSTCMYAVVFLRIIPAQIRSTCSYIRTCNKLEAVLSPINGLRAVFALEVKHWNLDIGSMVLGSEIGELSNTQRK